MDKYQNKYRIQSTRLQGYDYARAGLYFITIRTIASTATATTIKSQPKPSQSINKKMAAISPKSGSISRVIGSYKSAVSKHAHRLGYEFEWQSRFYDHIIRNKNEYFRISNYIKNNPEKWEDDKFN